MKLTTDLYMVTAKIQCVCVCVCVGGGDEYVLGHKFDTMFIMARAGQCVSWGGVIVGVCMGCWEERGGLIHEMMSCPVYCCFSCLFFLDIVSCHICSTLLNITFEFFSLDIEHSENAVKRSEFV